MQNIFLKKCRARLTFLSEIFVSKVEVDVDSQAEHEEEGIGPHTNSLELGLSGGASQYGLFKPTRFIPRET